MNDTNTNNCTCSGEPGGASPETVNRRKFLTRLCVVLGTICAAILGVPFIGFVVAPLFGKPRVTWRSVGKVEAFEVGKTVSVSFEDSSPLPWAGVTARGAAWLRRESANTFIAYSVHCTHLGCPVRWMDEANLFLCPCHGGVYYKDGSVAAGPPPKPLVRFDVRISDGQVQIKAAPIPIVTTL